MRAEARPTTLIRFVADTAREAAEDELEYSPEAPAREAFATAFYAVSVIVGRVLADAGQLPDTITRIRAEAHRRARQVDGDIRTDAEQPDFIRQAHEVPAESSPPDE